jgi:Acetyltransferase (isoleucine patch superfamily)
MKKTLKSIFKIVLIIINFPFLIWYIARTKIPYANYKNVAISLSKYTGERGVLLRQAFYKRTLKECGDNLRVHYGAYFVYPNIKVGRDCTVEEYSIVSMCDLGNDVIIAARVSIMSGGNHHEVDDLNLKFVDSLLPLKHISIGSNVWIGTHAVIMNDVANGCVIGAGAVLTRKFEENMIIAGIPGAVIRKRGVF